MTGTNRANWTRSRFGGGDLRYRAIGLGRERACPAGARLDAATRRCSPAPRCPALRSRSLPTRRQRLGGSPRATPGGHERSSTTTRVGIFCELTVPAGRVAIALGGGALWVAALRAAKIVRVDVVTGAKVNWARLVLAAYGLDYGGGYVWAGSPNDDVVYRVDPRVRDARGRGARAGARSNSHTRPAASSWSARTTSRCSYSTRGRSNPLTRRCRCRSIRSRSRRTPTTCGSPASARTR